MSRHSIPSDWLNASYLEQKPPGAQCLGGFSVSALRVVDRKLFDVTHLMFCFCGIHWFPKDHDRTHPRRTGAGCNAL